MLRCLRRLAAPAAPTDYANYNVSYSEACHMLGLPTVTPPEKVQKKACERFNFGTAAYDTVSAAIRRHARVAA